MFQAHVEGHGFDWATAVFSTSAIHQGSICRLLGPFQLSIPQKQVLSWPLDCQQPVVKPRTKTTWIRTRVPVRLLESPRHSGATDEGVTPRLLRVGLPGVLEDRKPMKMTPGPALAR